MRILVIGHGSIGNRHASILRELGCDVSLVSSQKNKNYVSYDTIGAALNNCTFDKIIIANPTYLHQETLKEIISFPYPGTVLVEKPLFSSKIFFPENHIQNIYVAYNLRFHDLIQQLKILLADEELISFSVQVGSYLPNWRKNSDYRDCYSSLKKQGGGVLRDLSHELDYVLWLCGACKAVTAMGGHYSNLEIDSDDVYVILMRCERCPIINIQMDYLNKNPTRKITVITRKNHTFFLDLISGELYIDGKIFLHVSDAINKTYVTQHQNMLKNNFSDFCDFKQGMAVMHLIETIEQASVDKKWIMP